MSALRRAVWLGVPALLACLVWAGPLSAQDANDGAPVATQPATQPSADPASPPATRPATRPAPAAAELAADPNNVIEVRVVGNEQVSQNAVLAELRSRVGQPYVERVAIEDQRRLLDTGKFADVQITSARTGRGVVVTVAVREHARIHELSFQGGRHFSAKELRSAVSLQVPGPVDRNRIEAARQTLVDKYKGDSYYFVNIVVDEEALVQGLLVYRIVEGPRIRVRNIYFRFEGPRSFTDFKLRQQIRTTRAIWILSRGKLEAAQLSRDAIDLEAFYRDRGFLDAEVTPELRFSQDKRKAWVTFFISQGPRYRIAELRFEGNTVFSAEELTRRLKMVQGRPYEALELHRDTEALKNTYGEIGHVDADVRSELVYLNENAPLPAWAQPTDDGPPALVALRYSIIEGQQYRVGRITIRGNDVTKERVIRRQLRFFPGQLFNTVAADESEKRLKESQLFSDVNISPFGEAPDVRDALVAVEETATARFVIGFGVSTNSGLTGMVSLSQQNFSWTDPPESLGDFFGHSFKGDGQLLKMDLEAGTELYTARLNWREPYFLDRGVSLGAGAFATQRQRDNYDENRLGASASLGKLFPNRWYGELAVQPENIELNDLDDDAPPEVVRDEGDTFLTSFAGTLVRDRTDSRWMPSRGDRLTLSYRQFVGDYTFGKAGTEYTRYFTLYNDALDRKHILAARGELASILGDDSPVFERYYGGGLGSIRGFEFRGISPRSGGFPGTLVGRGEPIGGEMMAYLGSEYSFPVVGETLRGVVFVDSGTVQESWGVETWRVSAGFGVRLHIDFFGPVPMSLDFGFPLVKDEDDDTQLVSFAFGWVF